MSHSLTSNILSTPAHFLLVLLINHHTLNHHTLHQEETYTHLKNTHHLPRSHDLRVHILPASHPTSTLELHCKNQVTKVIFVALHLCFHGGNRNAWHCVQDCDGLLALRINMFNFVFPAYGECHIFLFLSVTTCLCLSVTTVFLLFPPIHHM